MRAADLASNFAFAWKVRPLDPPLLPDHSAACRTWILHSHHFHPFWAWWQIATISLRDIEGVKPAHKAFPEATHEFLIVSLNPERGDPDIDAIERGDDYGDTTKPRFLTPVDVCRHFQVRDDLQAAELCDMAVAVIIKGALSPDSDFRESWNDVVDATARHYREGRHD